MKLNDDGMPSQVKRSDLMNKNLEKIRDELAEKSFEIKERPSSNWTYKEIYNEGFNACYEQLAPVIEAALYWFEDGKDFEANIYGNSEAWDEGEYKEAQKAKDSLKKAGLIDE